MFTLFPALRWYNSAEQLWSIHLGPNCSVASIPKSEMTTSKSVMVVEAFRKDCQIVRKTGPNSIPTSPFDYYPYLFAPVDPWALS